MWVMKKERSRLRADALFEAEAEALESWPERSAKAVMVQRRDSRLWFRLLSSGMEEGASEGSREREDCRMRSLRASRSSPKKSWLMRWA